MRLLNVHTKRLQEFLGSKVPHYAILSHTWKANEELTFHEIEQQDVTMKSKSGYAKLEHACQQAARDDLSWIWIDTVCIDKSSSSELGEAINSMFGWYKGAQICYAYLDDVSDEKDMKMARWFTRGWTLQELLAPTTTHFYSSSWKLLGELIDLRITVSQITGINEEYLTNSKSFREASIAARMCWASMRITTRIEDVAYCLLGLFDVNMPLLYGEGERAFVRLQEEIMKNSSDQSLFAWSLGSSCFAHTPGGFKQAGDIVPTSQNGKPYSMTNKGLSIRLPLVMTSDDSSECLGILDCHRWDGNRKVLFGIPLRQMDRHQSLYIRLHKRLVEISPELACTSTVKDVFIANQTRLMTHPFRSFRVHDWSFSHLDEKIYERFRIEATGNYSLVRDGYWRHKTIELPRNFDRGSWRYAKVILFGGKYHIVLVQVSTTDLFSASMVVWPFQLDEGQSPETMIDKMLRGTHLLLKTQPMACYIRGGPIMTLAVFLDRRYDKLILRVHEGPFLHWLRYLPDNIPPRALHFADNKTTFSRWSNRLVPQIILYFRFVSVVALLTAIHELRQTIRRVTIEFRRSQLVGDTRSWQRNFFILETTIFVLSMLVVTPWNRALAFCLGMVCMPLGSFVAMRVIEIVAAQ